jgi:hypothetical protein
LRCRARPPSSTDGPQMAANGQSDATLSLAGVTNQTFPAALWLPLFAGRRPRSKSRSLGTVRKNVEDILARLARDNIPLDGG